MNAAIDAPAPTVASEIAASQREWEAKLLASPVPQLGKWHAVGPFAASDHSAALKMEFPPEKLALAADGKADLAAKHDERSWKVQPSWVDGKAHTLTGDNSATYLYRTVISKAEGTLAVALGSDDGVKVWVNGVKVHESTGVRGITVDSDKFTAPIHAGANHLLMKVTNGTGGYAFSFRLRSDGGVPADVRAALEVPAAERSQEQSQRIAVHYRSIAPALASVRKELATAEKEKADLEKSLGRCVVAKAGNPRTVRIYPRGNWLDDSGPAVEPAIPSYFGTLETKGRATRLDLARWLVRKDNPLTARVFVNRLWKLFFGTGISQRLDDLGAMGDPPVHPELLDWLAVEFVESGWNVKHMVRLLLVSRAYQQSSVASPELLERDPFNRLVARQSRWRLDAEMVRDNALSVSGLLSPEIGGKSVKPYQPAGYWEHLNFPKRKWKADDGMKLYRRGMYTWWQRSFLHPSLMAFDAPNREECTAERPRSNIPQQALVPAERSNVRRGCARFRGPRRALGG